jgi:DNA-directed RNA polymerase subunit RPC12/RpoP
MPWCDTCDRFVESDELTDDGACPTCEEHLSTRPKVPWYFKLLIGATGIYLGYRAYHGIDWLVHHA